MIFQVLVADDDRAIRESLATALELAGYLVTRCADGVQALLQSRWRRRSRTALLHRDSDSYQAQIRRRELREPTHMLGKHIRHYDPRAS